MIGNTNAIPASGGHLYRHDIQLKNGYGNAKIVFIIINDSNTPFTIEDIRLYLLNNGFSDNNNCLIASGYYKESSSDTFDVDSSGVFGIYCGNASPYQNVLIAVKQGRIARIVTSGTGEYIVGNCNDKVTQIS